MTRSVFYVSDGTGITAETLGHTLLTQFEQIHFNTVSLPFINSKEKMDWAVQRINRAAQSDGEPPLVFSTLVDARRREELAHCRGLIFDFFDAFTPRLEEVLGVTAQHVAGRSHGMGNMRTYAERMDALHFAIQNDDGATTRDYPNADVVVMGVSRTGKTPTCMYLALNYGIRAANYPLADDDFDRGTLPASLEPYRKKLFGLTVDAERLHQIRTERRPNSQYASVEQCNKELKAVERMLKREGIPCLNITQMSVEEIAAQLMQQAALMRRI
ncbi:MULTISPECIES: posphoenolpyruvate synthetase regulatory kinase/phosphorylase PpsR [Ectothiorhodospira]|uniref:posphoenolpyruvate synthetase regulatory kinase/phosphorylase PpsR n=1 Tax=Ectothiorhodospira TaxID=1051 RepID=UPI00024A877C|nr:MULTISPECIES: pyruvate, water dikinase regulatory protein [Ectothiorhodospira]EHQ51828.1 hypothetical protein ECTPHS_03989 [Ectothiorhodospira sp. PHS-1]MCG5512301.1 kinase/pyrophosphorylase [Ectothiorhodospira shaposhnikovii]